MSFPDPEAEEQTLHTFFGEHIPGGETSKLRPACTFVQQFIAQELWWVPVRDRRHILVLATAVAPSHSVALALGGDDLHKSPNMRQAGSVPVWPFSCRRPPGSKDYGCGTTLVLPGCSRAVGGGHFSLLLQPIGFDGVCTPCGWRGTERCVSVSRVRFRHNSQQEAGRQLMHRLCSSREPKHHI